MQGREWQLSKIASISNKTEPSDADLRDVAKLLTFEDTAVQEAAAKLITYVSSVGYTHALTEVGMLPRTVKLLKSSLPSEQTRAVAFVKALARHPHAKMQMKDAGVFPPLVQLLQSGNDAVRAAAAWGVALVAADSRCTTAVAAAGVVPSVVQLLRKEAVQGAQLPRRTEEDAKTIQRSYRDCWLTHVCMLGVYVLDKISCEISH